MFGALLFKEWLKVRGVYAAVWLLHLAAGVHSVVHLRSLFAAAHPETLWYQAAVLGHFPFDIFRHLPWAGALALAVAIFLVPVPPGAWKRGSALALAILSGLAVTPFLAMARQRLTGKNQ